MNPSAKHPGSCFTPAPRTRLLTDNESAYRFRLCAGLGPHNRSGCLFTPGQSWPVRPSLSLGLMRRSYPGSIGLCRSDVSFATYKVSAR